MRGGTPAFLKALNLHITICQHLLTPSCTHLPRARPPSRIGNASAPPAQPPTSPAKVRVWTNQVTSDQRAFPRGFHFANKFRVSFMEAYTLKGKIQNSRKRKCYLLTIDFSQVEKE